jgi:hypothetical protein
MPEIYPIIPTTVKASFFFFLVLACVVLPALLVSYLLLATRLANVELSASGIVVHATPYGRTIPGSAIVVSEVRHIDLNQEKEYQPAVRTNGIALPGYRAGWFRLRNGERALLFVTDPREVVYAPTRDGYSVLLSVAQPEQFVTRLRELLVSDHD